MNANVPGKSETAVLDLARFWKIGRYDLHSGKSFGTILVGIGFAS
jgi:hypothetical protein